MKVTQTYSVFTVPFFDTVCPVMVDTTSGIRRRNNTITDRQLVTHVCTQWQWPPEEVITMYTDGSKRIEAISVGAAVWVPSMNLKLANSLSSDATVFTAEAWAVNRALDEVLRWQNQQCRKVMVCTDSRSVAIALADTKLSAHKHEYIVEARHKIMQYQKAHMSNKIGIVWVPAHVGVKHNETVDILAKEATHCLPEDHIYIPARDVSTGVRRVQVEATEREVINRGNYVGVKYFSEFFQAHNSKPWFTDVRENRGFVTMVNRLRANHYNLGESLARKHYIQDSTCKCGRTSESVDHVAFDCPTYTEQRSVFLQQLQANNIHNISRPSVWRWLRTNNYTALKIFYYFLRSIQMII